jgi:hypothetical protein
MYRERNKRAAAAAAKALRGYGFDPDAINGLNDGATWKRGRIHR